MLLFHNGSLYRECGGEAREQGGIDHTQALLRVEGGGSNTAEYENACKSI
jgi:hypothetical protein